MGYKERDKEITTQPLVNNSQMQTPNNSNKWVVNLSSAPVPSPKSLCYPKDQIMQ